ncbi:regulator of G-protein signaling 9-binding protein-like isoform X2 [Littorina saxatilis]|uniref:regulator of G-protein signaling 9-binding protein-like isoform X2 n=1 Tax=Littorina saxatilis TaxID=31220 RepID=UPI0038B69D8F
MTGGPVAVPDVMCSETNVTITSLQIRSKSSVDLAKEPATNPNDVTTSRSTTDVTLTSLHIQRTNTTTSSPDGPSDGDSEQPVNSVSHRRMSESPKVVTFGGILPPDVNGFEQLLKIRPNPGSSATVEDCSKLVFQLSKELALLHGLSGGIGGDSDSNKLREELRLSRYRACTLAQQNATALIPLYRSKSSLKKDDATESERLYRIYSGCLEYLVYLLHKIKSLLSIFHINNDTCFLIQTGITDPVGFVHKASSTVVKDGTGSAIGETSQSPDDTIHLNGDMKSMQQLLYVVNSACDVQPWDVVDENQDAEKQRKSSIQQSSRRESRGLTFDDGSRRRQRLVMAVAVIVTLMVIVAVAVTVSLLTTS